MDNNSSYHSAPSYRRFGKPLVLFMMALGAQLLILPAEAHANDAPTVDSFSAVQIFGDWWLFTGTITDEDPESVVMNFGGILTGVSVNAESDGTFSYVEELAPGESGAVDVQGVDSNSQLSNVESEYVIN